MWNFHANLGLHCLHFFFMHLNKALVCLSHLVKFCYYQLYKIRTLDKGKYQNYNSVGSGTKKSFVWFQAISQLLYCKLHLKTSISFLTCTRKGNDNFRK